MHVSETCNTLSLLTGIKGGDMTSYNCTRLFYGEVQSHVSVTSFAYYFKRFDIKMGDSICAFRTYQKNK